MEETDQSKSERATPFKLAKARERGVVARSSDLGFLASLATFLGFCWFMGPRMKSSLATVAERTLTAASTTEGDSSAVLAQAGATLTPIAASLLWLGVSIFFVVLVMELVQTGPIFTFETLKFDFSRLSPANAAKRVFSVTILIHTAKSVLKMLVYCGCAFLVVRSSISRDIATILGAESLADAMARCGARLFAFFVGATAAFAALDQIIVRQQFQKNMRMSRREVRREVRDREGDPRVRQRRKQLYREFLKQSQGLQNIKSADVLVVNPTHYAVALQYEPKKMAAPKIVARGKNQHAVRLRRLALTYGVTVVQNEALARALHAKGEMNKLIPEPLYRPVAELYLAIRARRSS